MAHPQVFDDADPLLRQVRKIALTLPHATEKVAFGRPTFRIGKMFAVYGGSVKGGERHDQALLFIPDPDERPALQQDRRFFVPAYLGPHGWLAFDLGEATDWQEVGELLDSSYRQVAPATGRGGTREPGADATSD